MSVNTSEEPVPLWVSRWGGVLAIALFVLILSAPTPAGLPVAGQRLGAIAALMAVCWMTQSLPIELTSLLPLVFFPWLGIQSAGGTAAAYFNDSSFLYLGGFVIALGIERWRLHERIALNIAASLGVGPKRIVLGFMLATFVLSMWISNTAATLLMLPIALALLQTLSGYRASTTEIDPGYQRLSLATTLGVGYAATIGGMATLVGTPTNLVFNTVFQRMYPAGPPVSAGQWMIAWTPCALAFLLCTWGLLTWRAPTPQWRVPLERSMFLEQRRALGPLRGAEVRMLFVFLLTVFAWLLRTDFTLGEWTVLPGWGRLSSAWLQGLGIAATEARGWVNDSTVAMTFVLLMFLIPAERDAQGNWQALMDWQTANRLPWGILLLFGGGFALADACRATGLAEWCGVILARGVAGWPLWAMILAIGLLVTFLSELTSNVATATALLPMIAGTAVALDLDPRWLMLPATLAASCGFMLPVSTPPHAIVFGTGRVPLIAMIRYGTILNLLGSLLILATAYCIMAPQFGLQPHGAPEWARLAVTKE